MSDLEMQNVKGGGFWSSLVEVVVGGPVGATIAIAGAIDGTISIGIGISKGWNCVIYNQLSCNCYSENQGQKTTVLTTIFNFI